MLAHLLLTDDLALISSGLQLLMDGFNKFCKRWHLAVNMIKTRVAIFNRHLAFNASDMNIIFNGKSVNETTDYEYVGITFSTRRNRFSNHITIVSAKANRALYSGMSLVRNAVGNQLTAKNRLFIFDTQIRPIFEYATPVLFSDTYIKDSENIQSSFVFKRAQYYATVKYWLRISQLSNRSFLHDVLL